MSAVVRRAFLLVVVVCGLLCLLIWYGGPRIGFGLERRSPLESEQTRQSAMMVVVAAGLVGFAGWITMRWYRNWRTRRATRNALASRGAPQPQVASTHPELADLREQFDDGLRDLLARSDPYDLPWYLVIGAGGSGKSTLLRLVPPRTDGDREVAGPGPVSRTNTCRWTLSPEAAFLDTTGRYTTQPASDETSKEGWTTLIELMGRVRPIRPLNGVIVTVDFPSLVGPELESLAAAVRRRLNDLDASLGQAPLPVYVVVTKCDLIRGFGEFMDDESLDLQRQTLGTTFNVKLAKNQILDDVGPSLSKMLGHLNSRLFRRLDSELAWLHNERILTLLQGMTALRGRVEAFVRTAFASMQYEQDQVLLRGIYFTGTSTEVSRRPRTSADGRARGSNPLFGEGLLKEVLLPESGLAGVNPLAEKRLVLRWLATIGTIVVAAIIISRAMFVSYGLNAAHAERIRLAVGSVGGVTLENSQATLQERLVKLDSLRRLDEFANPVNSRVPLAIRWGLFQGPRLGSEARAAYLRHLNAMLMPVIDGQIVQGLSAGAGSPERLYRYLKAYLMRTDPDRAEAEHLRSVGVEVLNVLAQGNKGIADGATSHYAFLLEHQERLARLNANESLIAEARRALQGAQMPRLMYQDLAGQYSETQANPAPLRLLDKLGMDPANWLTLRNGSLKDPIASLYTAEVFTHLVGAGSDGLVRRFYNDTWVWGNSAVPAQFSESQLRGELTTIYANDYVAFWERLLANIEPRQPAAGADAQTAAELLDVLGSPSGPLLLLLRTIDENTNLLPKEAEGKPSTGALARLEAGRKQVGDYIQGRDGEKALTFVTARFERVHRLLAGPTPPIDDLLGQLRAIQDPLRRLGMGSLQEDVRIRAEVKKLTGRLRQSAAVLPAGVSGLVGKVADVADGTVGPPQDAGEWRQVVERCQDVTRGRYPFTASSSTDVLLSDFGRIFGPGGVYEQFGQKIETLIDKGDRWSWRPESAMAGVNLARLEEAERIRQVFFPAGGTLPQFTFTLDRGSLEGAGGADRFELQIHGATYDYLRNSPPPSLSFTWPGKDRSATIGFGASGTSGRVVQQGDWAWFRLIEQFRREPEGDGRYRLLFNVGGRTASVRLQTATTNDPFVGLQMLRRFGC